MRPTLRTILIIALIAVLDVAVIGGMFWHLDEVKRNTLFGDGDSVIRGLGDPTREQYLDEMRRRLLGAYPAFALAAVLLVNLLFLARRQGKWPAVAQAVLVGYVAVTALYWNPTWYDDHDTGFTPPVIKLFSAPAP
ncbi:hypothetical protein [Herbidospora yilanensis]|uniref:hypothetical protein n=1 Tax=Herbidospora yilanensis TaxID=354426 RepID=UPI000785C4EA|nr:hypothetical protein [Herbidospora yilanensis]